MIADWTTIRVLAVLFLATFVRSASGFGESLRRRRDWLALQLTTLPANARQAIRNAIAPLSEIGR
jgi:hypothetical protein